MERISEKVIRCLVEVEGYIAAKDLAVMTGLSASNIKHNLSFIKEELEKYQVVLKSTPKKGICLIATKSQRQAIICALAQEVSKSSEFYTFRKEYILETLFLFPANYTIQLFMDELLVSKNTIQKDLGRIENELAKFHVKIKRVRNQGIILEGEEFNIRQSMIEHNNSKYWNSNRNMIIDNIEAMDKRISKKAYTYLSNMYSKKNLVKIQEILKCAEQRLGIRFIDISFCRLLEYISITIERVSIGKEITRNTRGDVSLQIHGKYLEVAEEILGMILPERKKKHHAEAQYLAARLFVALTYNDKNIICNHEFNEVVISFLVRIEEIIDTKVLSVSEELIFELNVAFMRVKIREQYQILDWNDLHTDIEKQLTGLYGICMANLFEVEKHIDCHFRQDDIAWIVLLIDLCIKDVKNRIPVLFLHGTNTLTALYQKGKLEARIPKINIVKCIYFNEFKKELAKDMLVISTVPFQEQEDNIIEITKHISEKDMELIIEGLENVEWKYQGKLLQEIVQEVFNETLIISDLTVYKKEEAIIKMSELLKEQGYVEDGYCEKVLEREKICPTVIGNEIAIPHHYQDYIHKNGIAVARLKNAISWNEGEKVKLIFLMAIKYKEPIKVKILFHYLYVLIENQELLKGIKTAGDSMQILEYITHLIL